MDDVIHLSGTVRVTESCANKSGLVYVSAQHVCMKEVCALDYTSALHLQ